MKVEPALSVNCDLSVTTVMDAVAIYEKRFGEPPSALIYEPSIFYVPEIFYGTHERCIAIRTALRAAIPVYGLPKDFWAIIGRHGVFYSGGY